VFNIDPKFQTACVLVRSLSVSTTAAEVTEPVGPTLLGHANLDGADDHLEITLVNNTNVLSWTDDWSIGFHMVEIHNSTEGLKRTIATRGNNGMYFSKGAGNWGFYATATDGEYDPTSNEGMTHSHGANTWFVPPDDSKHLFTYKASTGKLRWYCDSVLKATVQMTPTEMTQGVSATDVLQVGDLMGGYYGGVFWDGHIDNLLLLSTNLVNNSEQVTEYFSNNDFTTHLEYSDKILSWFKLDPDPEAFPEIFDFIGDATGVHTGSNAATAFVTTGEEQPVESVASTQVNTEPPSGIFFGAAVGSVPSHYGVYLDSTSLPNNIELQKTTTRIHTGLSKLLGNFPVVTTGSGVVTTSSFFGAGDVATQGLFVGGTLLNEPMTITIVPFGSAGESDSEFRLQLDIQLLCNEVERVDTIN
jgi:hypothetical protein